MGLTGHKSCLVYSDLFGRSGLGSLGKSDSEDAVVHVCFDLAVLRKRIMTSERSRSRGDGIL